MFEKVTITIEEFEEYNEEGIGVCLYCGAIRFCCEPDARKYTCDECDLPQVYGAEELLIMGFVS